MNTAKLSSFLTHTLKMHAANTNPMATLCHCSNCWYDGVLFVILLLLSRTPPLNTHMFVLVRTLCLFHSHSLPFAGKRLFAAIALLYR